MNFLKNKVSFTRYYNPTSKILSIYFDKLDGSTTDSITEKEEPDLIDMSRIKNFAFKELSEDSIQDKSSGWVDIMNPLNTDFKDTTYKKNNFIALSIRTDTKKVPAQALKSEYYKVLQKRQSESKDKISYEERKEIKEAVREKLLKKVLPSTKINDMIWDTNTGEILFFSTNESANITFLNLFKETFGINLKLISPHVIAYNEFKDKILRLKACSFANNPEKEEHKVIMLKDATTVQSIVANKFMGEEFLTWLWWRSQTNSGVFSIPDNMLELYVDDRIVLKEDDNGKLSCVICNGDNVDLYEARKALSLNKRVAEAKFKIFVHDQEYLLTLNSVYFRFQACKTPKVTKDKEDLDGVFYEKIFLLQKIIKYIEYLFISFLKIRTGEQWKTIRADIRDWASCTECSTEYS